VTSSNTESTGFFIVFEGLDGAGKTTQIRLLADYLRQTGYDVVCLKEPTDGPWGQKIRHRARQEEHAVTPDMELEWFLQDRREDVVHNILPALARGQVVLLDRYYFSTMAYQGALGYDPEQIRQRNEVFAPPPDLLLLLEIPPQQGLERIAQQRERDGFERLDYLERVATIFAAMRFPYLRRVPATAAPEVVHAHICQEVQHALAQRSAIGQTPGPTRDKG
jgi:dTMP kinase